ncbi:MAG: preprotein translocase subunit SecY, partial [Planctomycetes bacterium]|nr:preprotein translocase subunit SecY [Planctomycetota bacterium]
MNKIFTIFRIPELRKKIFFTALVLIIYRIGYFIPLPVINQAELAKSMAAAQQSTLGQVLGFVSLFSGGNLSNSCIFALGIMPYISASIILQLLSSSGLSPYLEKLRKEPNGQKKINEYTRFLTVPICLIQAFFWVSGFMNRPGPGEAG